MTTTDPEELRFEGAVRRIFRLMLLLGVAGCAAAWITSGWAWGIGFLLGAVASFLNFRWLQQLVDALGRTTVRLKRGTAVLLCLRYVLLGIAGYAILKYSPLSLSAAFAGLFVAVAAVIVEILYQLVYARN